MPSFTREIRDTVWKNKPRISDRWFWVVGHLRIMQSAVFYYVLLKRLIVFIP